MEARCVMAKKNGRGFIVYDTYLFKDHDPVIDEYRAAREKEKIRSVTLHNRSNVSQSCIRNLDTGKTRRPQNATISALMGAMGYVRTWSKDNDQARLVERLDAKFTKGQRK
jgi:hypothetical protein